MPPEGRSDAAGLRRALRASRLQFAGLGALAGTWGAHIPSVRREHGLDEGGLAVLLVGAALGCVVTLWLAGRVVARFGTRRCAVAAAAAMAAGLALVLPLPGFAAPLAAALVLGAGSTLFDVCINTEGATLERLGGRAVMSGLHGMWSVGGMAGALLAAALLAAGVAPRLQLACIALGLFVAMAWAARGMHDGATAGAAHAAGAGPAHFVWPRGLLLVLGLLSFAGMTAEGVMYDWSVLYLAQELGMPQARAALGYAVFCVAMAAARFAGDALRERYAEVALLRAGAALAAVAMATLLLAATPWVALVGFVLVGAGLAPVAPILYGAATRVPGASPSAALAAVTSIGYLGFMVGPPLVGAIAQAGSLTLGLSVVVLAAAALALGVGRLPRR